MTPHIPRGTWTLDPSATQVAIQVKNWVFKTVNAQLRLVEGAATVTQPVEQSTIRFSLGAASIESGHKKRDEHVTSKDFLDSASHPTIDFASTSIEEIDPATHIIRGQLTTRTTVSDFRLDISDLQLDGDEVTFIASAVADRRALGLDKMPSFMIGNHVSVSVQGVGRRNAD